MVLQLVKHAQDARLLHVLRVLVRRAVLPLAAADLENVLEALQRHGDDLVVGVVQQQHQRRNDAALHHRLGLHRRAARRGVGHRPHGLLSDVELAVAEHLDERAHDLGVQNRLHGRTPRARYERE